MSSATFGTAAVLGAGVMGSQIAAHLANAGLLVHLLDVPGEGDARDSPSERAVLGLGRRTPPPLFSDRVAARIVPGNFDDHLARVAGADWVIEAVIEDLDVKCALLARAARSVRDDAVVSTNTSGLPVAEIAAALPAALRPRFLGTHFFNPPRYLRLVEAVPTKDTDAALLARLAEFLRVRLGKGVVVARDTPGFIANRVGMQSFLAAVRLVGSREFTVEQIDALTGPALGRPKSATFRTADLAGLDVVLRVAEHLARAVPPDERLAFEPPPLLRRLVAAGALGDKTGRGFWRREGRRRLVVDPATLEYRDAAPFDVDGLAEIEAKRDLPSRCRAAAVSELDAGRLFRSLVLDNAAYAARCVPAIAETTDDVDRAMRWGFGFELGPFETWDAAGFADVSVGMRRRGVALPSWVDWIDPANGFHRGGRGGVEAWTPGVGWRAVPRHADETRVADAVRDGVSRRRGEGWSLVDTGEGVLLFAHHAKAGTLGRDVVDGLHAALDEVEKGEDVGLVVASPSADFSLGANLGELALAAAARRWRAIGLALADFQSLGERIRRAAKPVVVAVAGRALGGGCELAMSSSHPVAAAESYLGLVEAAVGLVPSGGGAARMAALASARAADRSTAAIRPHLRRAFETVAKGSVSRSADDAQDLGFLPRGAPIVMHGDRLLHVARQEVLRLAAQGFAPAPPAGPVRVLGAPARAAFEVGIRHLREGRFIEPHDEVVARHLAWVMTGGDLPAPADVPFERLLELEREAFLSLLGERETQARIAALLTRRSPRLVQAAAKGFAGLAHVLRPHTEMPRR